MLSRSSHHFQLFSTNKCFALPLLLLQSQMNIDCFSHSIYYIYMEIFIHYIHLYTIYIHVEYIHLIKFIFLLVLPSIIAFKIHLISFRTAYAHDCDLDARLCGCHTEVRRLWSLLGIATAIRCEVGNRIARLVPDHCKNLYPRKSTLQLLGKMASNCFLPIKSCRNVLNWQ